MVNRCCTICANKTGCERIWAPFLLDVETLTPMKPMRTKDFSRAPMHLSSARRCVGPIAVVELLLASMANETPRRCGGLSATAFCIVCSPHETVVVNTLLNAKCKARRHCKVKIHLDAFLQLFGATKAFVGCANVVGSQTPTPMNAHNQIPNSLHCIALC